MWLLYGPPRLLTALTWQGYVHPRSASTMAYRRELNDLGPRV